MKTSRRILATVLFISSLIPLGLGIEGLVNTDNILRMFGVEKIIPDTQALGYILGICMLGLVIIYVFAMVWTATGKKAGISISKGIGWSTLGLTMLMYFKFRNLQFEVNDYLYFEVLKSAVILLLAYFAGAKARATEPIPETSLLH